MYRAGPGTLTSNESASPMKQGSVVVPSPCRTATISAPASVVLNGASVVRTPPSRAPVREVVVLDDPTDAIRRSRAPRGKEIAGQVDTPEYVIQSEEPQPSAVEALALYKDLSEVEQAFAGLKDVIDMRPVYHRTPERVQAHIFVAALAFLLHRAIEKKLKAARLDLSATEALTALKSVCVVDIDLGKAKPSVPSHAAHSAPPPWCVPSVSSILTRRRRPRQARPSCSEQITISDRAKSMACAGKRKKGNMG